MQATLTAVLVIGSLLYASWSLLPAAARRGVALRLLRLPHADRLGPLTAAWQRAARRDGGCACDGCDKNAVRPKAAQVATVRIHRPTPR